MKVKSFSQKIIVYMLILLIILFSAVGIYSNWSIYKNLKQAALQKADVQIEHTNDTVNTNFDILKLLIYKILGNQNIIGIFSNPNPSVTELRAAEQYLSDDIYSSYCWTNSIIKSVYAFKNENTYIRTTRAPFYNSEIDENICVFKDNRDKYGIVISTPDINNESFYFSVPLEKLNGEKIGYIVITIDAERLSDTLSNVSVDDSNVYVVDENNIIYASSLKANIGEPLLSNNIYKREPLDSASSLYVVTEILYSDIAAKLQKSLLVYILVFVAGVILMIATAVVVIRRLTKPLRQLVDIIREFDGGNWEIRVPVYNDDEIDMIGTAFNSMCENINNLVNVVYQNEILARDAQLQALRAQINPHFLFNTLTTIATIAKKEKNELVSNMIRMLSKLLRERVITDNDDFSTLESELLLVDYYIYIQKVRFKGHINYELNKDKNVPDDCTIPKLMLQPLVENAVCHGLEKSVNGGTVFVNISCDETYLRIEVRDDGVGFDVSSGPSEDAHKHITIPNIKKRLEVYYGSDFVLDITSRIGSGTRVFIKIPLSGHS